MKVRIVGEEGATEADWARMLAEDGEDSHAAPCSAEIAERQRERLELRARLRRLLRLVQLVGGELGEDERGPVDGLGIVPEKCVTK